MITLFDGRVTLTSSETPVEELIEQARGLSYDQRERCKTIIHEVLQRLPVMDLGRVQALIVVAGPSTAQEPVNREIISVSRHHGATRTREYLQALHNLSFSLQARGQYAEAQELRLEVLALDLESLDLHSIGYSIERLQGLPLEMRTSASVIEAIERVLATVKGSGSLEHERIFQWSAELLIEAGRWQEALDAIERALSPYSDSQNRFQSAVILYWTALKIQCLGHLQRLAETPEHFAPLVPFLKNAAHAYREARRMYGGGG